MGLDSFSSVIRKLVHLLISYLIFSIVFLLGAKSMKFVSSLGMVCILMISRNSQYTRNRKDLTGMI